MALPYKKQQIESFQYNEDEEKEQIQPPIIIEQKIEIDREALIEAYKYLIEYKNNLFKVDLLLHTEDDISTIQELTSIKEQLQPAIEAQIEQIKLLQQQEEFMYSIERLKSEDVDKLSKAFYEKDNKWYNAKIISIDVDLQEAQVQFIGYQDNLNLHAIFIKVLVAPDASLFQVGTQCEAIYPADGRYYQCTIDKISEEGYYVKFKKYNNRELISIYHLREPKKLSGEQQVQKNQFEDLDMFVVPDNLKILPSDNEQQRQAKKKKLKAMKQAFKQAQYDKYSSEQQNKWKQFNQKVQTIKPDLGQKTESLYQSPYLSQIQAEETINKGLRAQEAKLKLKETVHLKRMF